MEVILILKRVVESREFESTNRFGQPEMLKVLTLEVATASGDLVVDAFGQVAESLEKAKLSEGDVLCGQLSFKVQERKANDDKVFYKTQIALTSYVITCHPDVKDQIF